MNGTDLPLVITAVPETPKNKGKVEPVFEVSLPAPDEIPELNTYRDSVLPVNNGLDFAIEDTRAREAAGIDRPPVVPLNGDNIHQVEEDMFEKIVPDGSLETLDPDEEVGDWTAYDPTLELSTYQYPTIDLLEQRDGNQSREVNRGELEENKNKIVQTLQNYKIDITSIKANSSARQSPCMKSCRRRACRTPKMKNLEDDIALSLSALGIRIIAPIPGKGTIGIEIPNSKPEIVSMRSVMSTEKFRDTKAELPWCLAVQSATRCTSPTLQKCRTCSSQVRRGKVSPWVSTVLISSISTGSTLPQVKFVLIDPKKVELSLYSNLESHLAVLGSE